MSTYRWGIIGPGRIATQFCQQFPQEQQLAAVASSHDSDKLRDFATQFNIPHVYTSHASLLADPDIDVVYIATTNNVHFDNIKAALQAGKHVLAEKPITFNPTRLNELTRLADSKHLILMEAQTIYHMPLYPKLLDFVADHHLGHLKTIQASFGLNADATDTEGRLLNRQLGGGALLDMGVYSFSLARRFMTAAPRLEATLMQPTTTQVDDTSVSIITNDHGELGTFNFHLTSPAPQTATIVYENGYFIIDHYLRPEAAIFVDGNGNRQTITAGNTAQAMGYEATDMATAIDTGTNPTSTWTDDVLALMTTLREQWHLVYAGE